MPVIFPVSPRGTTAWLSRGLNLEVKPAGATPADAPLVMGGGDGRRWLHFYALEGVAGRLDSLRTLTKLSLFSPCNLGFSLHLRSLFSVSP